MASCPLCSHCQQAGLNPPHDDISLIEKEIERLGQFMLQLNDSRIALLRRLNSIRSATRNLPLEVLSLIFLYAAPPVDIASRSLRLYPEETCPDSPEHYSPIFLQSVCFQWLHAVQSTPQLWSSLILDVPDVKHVRPSISVLQTYLKNVKNFSFSLELNFNKANLPINPVDRRSDDSDEVYDPEGYALLEPFYSTIFVTPENSHRFKVLRLSEMPRAWRTFPFENFSRLEELRLGSECSATDIAPTFRIFDDFRTPNLRRIIAKNTWMSLSPERVPFTLTVTVINLFRVPANSCFRLLVLFPNLIEFRARDCRLFDEHDVPDQHNDFTKSQLEVLEWTCSDDAWNTAFLEHAHLPVLRMLCWGGSQFEVNKDTLTVFFQRLPSSLVEMEVVQVKGNPIGWEYSWGEHWPLLTHVRKLSLRQCSFWSTSRALEHLSDENLLPSLREIRLIEPPYSKSESGGIMDLRRNADKRDEELVRTKIFQMVDQRDFGRKGVKFRFSTVDRDLNWEPKDGRKLRALLGRGFDLEIFEDGSLLRCLYEDYEDEEPSSGEENSGANRSSSTNSEDDELTSSTNSHSSSSDESGDEDDVGSDSEGSSSS